MRIAFLCKRHYMSKDVIVDRYARLYEIPFQLARLGHDVRGWCLSYGNAEQGDWNHDAAPGSLRWESRSLGRFFVPDLLSYPRFVLRRLRSFAPNILIGASDIPHVGLTAWLAKQLNIPYTVDLYDNFEGFGQARIPGMKTLLRRSTQSAALVTTTSQPLANYVLTEYAARGGVINMPSTVDKTVFHPLVKSECREALNLPLAAHLIGTAGGLHADKGVGTLYAAWDKLASVNSNVHLVLAGPVDTLCPPPTGDRVHYLGMLAHAQIAQLFSALDVGIIYLRDTVFGRYCFPQKAYEMGACGIPIVAGRVGAMADVLKDYPQCLYMPDDADDLAERVRSQLQHPTPPEFSIDDWSTLIARVEPELVALAAR